MQGMESLMIAMTAGSFYAMAALPLYAEPSSGGSAPTVREGKAGGPGTSTESTGQGHIKKERRSSGKHIQEEITIEEKARSGSRGTKGSGKGASESRTETGSGGGGVSGTTGK